MIKFVILGMLAVVIYISILETVALWLHKEPVDEAEVIPLREK